MHELFRNILLALLAGLATSLGGIIIYIIKKPNKIHMSIYLGFAAGIMIGISVFELIPEGIAMGNLTLVAVGFVIGCLLMWTIDIATTKKLDPIGHGKGQTFENRVSDRKSYSRMGYFIALGIALHNLPEGLAIGAGFGTEPKLGLLLAITIGLHNVPEGMSIAMPLRMSGSSILKVLKITLIAGLFTPIGAALGYMLVRLSPLAISVCLGMAAGAMTYIASDELIPESHHCHNHFANFGILSGFLLILISTGIS